MINLKAFFCNFLRNSLRYNFRTYFIQFRRLKNIQNHTVCFLIWVSRIIVQHHFTLRAEISAKYFTSRNSKINISGHIEKDLILTKSIEGVIIQNNIVRQALHAQTS